MLPINKVSVRAYFLEVCVEAGNTIYVTTEYHW